VVKSKADYLALSRVGRLGNYLRSWNTLAEVEASGYQGYLTIRTKVPGSPHFVPVTVSPKRDLARLMRQGARPGDLYYQQIPDPAARRVIQFEAMLDEQHATLYYELDTINPLRGIRERGSMVRGAAAAAILRSYLWELYT